MVITGATGAIGKYLMKCFRAMAYDPRKGKCPATAVLINCIGFNHDCFFRNADEEWVRVIETNLIDVADVIKEVLPHMRKEHSGRIINLSSMLSEWAVPGTSAYTASKAGLNAMIRVIAKEEAKHNILINNINLGYMDIGMTHKIPRIEEIPKQIPLGLGHPTEIVKTIKFLIHTNYITGSTIDVNGGLW